jgi:type II restriction enzyme
MEQLKKSILLLAEKYAYNLNTHIDIRLQEMREDNTSHYLIYNVLGVDDTEGYMIDAYQNKGRFLYKYAGAFLEEAVFLCFKHCFPQAGKVKIANNQGQRPKTFEIDCLIDNKAYEIKWRDATTDGDHITKEHTRVKAIRSYGYIPLRLMFYYPNRAQAISVQKTLETLYLGVGGKYYYGESAWQYLFNETKVDLKAILKDIAEHRKGGENVRHS